MNSIYKRLGRFLWVVMISGLGLLPGCQSGPRGDYAAIEFHPDSMLRYRFVSSRDVKIELTEGSNGKKEDSKTSRESLDMVMRIRPVKIDPYGLTTLEFTCESVQVKRTSFSGKGAAVDAMEALKGKSYTVQVTPTGQIENKDDFARMLKEIGQKSFVASTNPKQKVKNPDMILDWIFFQMYLWNVSASIPKPLDGIHPGSTWQSDQFMPWPVPIQNLPSRITTYTVKDITEQYAKRTAVIDSTYQLRDEPVLSFPLPYEGPYQIKGSLFSILRSYRHESLEGSGTEIFDLTDGVLEKDQQNYTLVTRADFILPLGQSLPTLTVQQSILIERLKDDAEGKPGGSQ